MEGDDVVSLVWGSYNIKEAMPETPYRGPKARVARDRRPGAICCACGSPLCVKSCWPAWPTKLLNPGRVFHRMTL